MSSANMNATDKTSAETVPVLAALTEILGRPPDNATAIFRGRNSRVYRVDIGADRFAAKFYGTSATDTRDRLGTEYDGLTFLHGKGIDKVPKPMGLSRAANCGVYEWIDGKPFTAIGAMEIDQALEFVAALHGLRQSPGAAAQPLASEACLSGVDLHDQIETRSQALTPRAESHDGLGDFLRQRFRPAFAECTAIAEQAYARIGLSFSAPLDNAFRTLSPSDFGFHNALHGNDGKAAFVDFEYFGWDDPVKLVSDFVLHPAMDLAADMQRRFLDGAEAIFAGEPKFGERFRALIALYGLRWCMILLNEFRDDRWHHRLAAGVREDRSTVESRQLAKAETLLLRLVEREGVFAHGK